MRRHLQQGRRQLVTGLFVAIGATMVYLLTLEPSTSFWDCGEFISIAALLQVGHPPGAPFYQLLAHAFAWIAGGNAMAVARCCNALSAVSGGGTAMFLYWTLLMLLDGDKEIEKKAPGNSHMPPSIAPLVGTLCYVFCDTAWFSAVESEVYSLAMLIASATLWAMLRWYRCPDQSGTSRWLCLVALLLGLGICTHLLTLLTTPALLILLLRKHLSRGKILYTGTPKNSHPTRLVPLLMVFFVIGLSPYLIIPIRANANPPINMGKPATVGRFKNYIARSQYEKAPLYPRQWRHHPNDALYNTGWNGGDTTFVGNVRYYFTYQLTYMYLRYLMWNFSGRYNDRHGLGSPQNGQFITGIPPIDRLLVGTAAPLPNSLPSRGHNLYFLLPLVLGLIGWGALLDNRWLFTFVTTIFLMGGIVLNLYLNHPCYEPRERDYAYILSFYAFCIFIAFGARQVGAWGSHVAQRHAKSGRLTIIATILVLLAVPTLMACQNWDDHDRSRRYIAHDAGANILNSCDRHEKGAILFCYGDNDTFPLWYLQSVEKMRTDIQVENITLVGMNRFASLLQECYTTGRPAYFTHYAFNQYGNMFAGHLQLEGNAYRLCDTLCDSVATEPFLRHLHQGMGWQSVEGVYVDEIGCKFIEQYWRDIVLLCQNLSDRGRCNESCQVLDKTLHELPLAAIQDVTLVHDIADAYHCSGDTTTAKHINIYLMSMLHEQLDYYHTMSLERQQYIPYTLAPRDSLYRLLARRGD